MQLIRWGRRATFGLALLCAGLGAQAQLGAPVATPETAVVESKTPEFQPGLAIGLGAGTQAIAAVDVTYGFSKNLTARLGFNYLQAQVREREFTVSGQDLDGNALLYNVDARMSTLQATIDVSPGERWRWLRFSTGVHVALNNSVSGDGLLRDNVVINDLELQPEELGGMELVYENAQTVMPYAAIGFGPALPWKKFAFNAEFGAFYRGAPTIQTIGLGLLEDNAQLGEVLSENFSPYLKWHPVVALRLAYRIHTL